MFRLDRRSQRPIAALAAAVAAAIGIVSPSSASLPADPHAGVARAQAVPDRAERVQDAAHAAPVRVTQVRAVVR